MFQVISPEVAVGADTDDAVETIEDIAQQGYKTVIDLCAPPEAKKLEEAKVKAVGLNYTNHPVTPANLTEVTLKAFVEIIEAAPKPVYVRCASGLRASVFTTLTLMEKHELDYSQTLESLGIKPKAGCPVDAFAKDYLEKQGKSV
jgi:uncharacterized protein (TIGR01244 family)